ncbi:DNA-processing protein DprA [bacterium]|nr:DNA-processing protein DprA [bacterium]
MQLSDSTIGLLALWLIPGLGPRRIQKLYDCFSRVESIFNASISRLSEAAGVDNKIASLIPQALDSDSLKKELTLIGEHQVEVLDFTQSHYPKLLKEIYNAPPVLYKKGNADLNYGFPIAFVGSRKASFAGKNICQKLIKEISVLKPETIIVSGLALGIDSVAHNTAMDCGLKTIGVLANGLSSIYPVRNKSIADRLCENGALITEFPMTTQPTATNFPLRNRIISGLSRGVVVVEAGERSGATITAGYALEQNRELFALPGPADSRFYVGTNRLIQKGQAKLVMVARDILEEFGPVNLQLSGEDLIKNHTDTTKVLSEDELKVLSILDQGRVQKDVIVNMSGIPIQNLLPVLTNLELKGLIVCKPGTIYEKK